MASERKRRAYLEQRFKIAIERAYKTAERKGEPINIEGLRNVAKNLGLIDATGRPPTPATANRRRREAARRR
jgi:hypothetical protein